MAHPMRGSAKKVSTGCRGKGENVGLENGVGAVFRIREGSIEDVINYRARQLTPNTIAAGCAGGPGKTPAIRRRRRKFRRCWLEGG